jgi:hypothetical protein
LIGKIVWEHIIISQGFLGTMVYGKEKVVGASGKGIIHLLLENGGLIFKKKKNVGLTQGLGHCQNKGSCEVVAS